MNTINRRAIDVPFEDLLDELKKANRLKAETLRRRDAEFGADRPKIGSYMENIALPDLYGFDMNDYYRDARLAMDVDLRNKLFWLDNSEDDGMASFDVSAGSMYYDMTLFGLKINYTKDGVPVFERHELADNPGLFRNKSLPAPFDFHTTGEMPIVHKRYADMTAISNDVFGGEIKVHFPRFNRGPLDIYIQLRGYDGFVADCAENSDYVRDLMDYIVAERLRFNKTRAKFLGVDLHASISVDDDWINIPFISPAIFDEFIKPAYAKIQENEGPVPRFHTCGDLVGIAAGLFSVFDKMSGFDVSGWNDMIKLDRIVDPGVRFDISFINTFVLTGSEAEHLEKLKIAKKIAERRRVSLNAQAIVKINGTIDDSLLAMNRFIDLARTVMSG